MKKQSVLALLTMPLLLAGTAPALAAPAGLTATLAAEAEYRLGEPITLTFGLRNDTGQDRSALTWNTPLERLDHEVQDYLRIRHADRDLPYEGRKFKRVQPDGTAYRVLRAGEQVRERLDLTTAFPITEPGQYTVTLAPRLREDLGQAELPRTAVTFRVLPGGPARSTGAAIARQGERAVNEVKFIGGSETRRNLVREAVREANRYVRKALATLPDPTPRPVPSEYTTWFGRTGSGRFELVQSHFRKIGTDSSNTTYDLKTCEKQGTYAYVYPNAPGKVYLCPMFWRAPITGQDSKAGTLVHEQSHFTVNGGTDDHVYGMPKCRNLAQDKPNMAVRNADNHEYFVEHL